MSKLLLDENWVHQTFFTLKRQQTLQHQVVSAFVILQTGPNIVKDLPNRDLVMFPLIYALILFMLSPSFLRYLSSNISC